MNIMKLNYIIQSKRNHGIKQYNTIDIQFTNGSRELNDYNSISTLSVFEISFYQNLFSVPIVLILVLFTEPENIQTKPRTRLEVFSFVFFCMLGMGTRFFSVDARKQNTVASVMVLGNLCKLSTIFIKLFSWESRI